MTFDQKPKHNPAISLLKVLWVAPNLNHYKLRLLSQLGRYDIELEIISGKTSERPSDPAETSLPGIGLTLVEAEKKHFQLSFSAYKAISRLIYEFRPKVLLMPVEKKFILIIGYLWVCRFFFKFDLISYNHPQITSANSGHSRTEFLLTKLLFSIYDRIIFYTETARDKAITENLLSARKAFFANNTLDTQSIWSLSTNRFRDETPPSILFIGRLVEYKGPELLLKYFEHIISRVPDCRLIIVGDGPLRDVIATAAENCERITWLGELTSEREISLYMDNSDIVFIPGASGLSIVHAFCYGKPYVTTSGTFRHGPELSYLMHEMNGLLLGSDFEKNVDEIIRLLSDREKRQRMSKEAYDMATKLRAENWCVQMVLGLRGLEQTRRLLVVD